MAQFPVKVARQDGEDITMSVERLEEGDLPPGDVTVRVLSIELQDALAVTPRGGVVREYPIVPGIDLTGEVIDSSSPEFRTGDLVLAPMPAQSHSGCLHDQRAP